MDYNATITTVGTQLTSSLDRVIVALASALDFVGVDEIHHAQRVALFAETIAAELGFSLEQRRFILHVGMLHDCGVAQTREHRQLSDSLEWQGAEAHCLRGQVYLKSCTPLARYADVVRWHHTRWEVLKRTIGDADLRLASNLIFLADRLDMLFTPYIANGNLDNRILLDNHGLIERLAHYKGSMFAPVLIDALQRAAQRESFWLQCDPAYILEELHERITDYHEIILDRDATRTVACLFARMVDSKSVYTLEHSYRVAQITRFLGSLYELNKGHLDMLEIAALLHDIGKLRISDSIIDKPGSINEQERAIVRRHSYDTGRILKRIFPHLPIADWAAMHHEDLRGEGYPERFDGRLIPLEARLITVADIFQALSQNRPYRARLRAGQVLGHLNSLVAQGRLDADVVALVNRHIDMVYLLAIGQCEPKNTVYALDSPKQRLVAQLSEASPCQAQITEV